MEIYNAYPSQVSRNMLNILSSHDTTRFLTLAHNDAKLQQLAATVQFTWVGAPSIYYGEELGMEGGPDPDNRRGMRWDKATPDNAMLRFYKRLIALRNGSRALQSGDPAILMTDDAAKTIAYSRTLGDDLAIVALNRSNQAQTLVILLPRTPAMNKSRARGFSDALSKQKYSIGQAATLKVKLSPLSSAILLPAGSG
jgi:cyclomaltodextrinase